jgi:predicted amidohydrolase
LRYQGAVSEDPGRGFSAPGSQEDTVKVALAQIFSGWGEVGANRERMARFTERAAAGGARMVAFPELCVSGIYKDPRVAEIAEDLEGESVAFVRGLARGHGLAVGFGFSERAPVKPYNAYCLVGADGELAGVYRKNHVPELEVPFWQGHEAQPVFPLLGFSVGVAICWDNKYPELLAHYAHEGVDLVLMPHAWDSDALDTEGRVIDYHTMEEIVGYHARTGFRRWKTHDQMRDDFYAYIPQLAAEHRFHAIFVNQAGRPHDSIQFVGPSFVVDAAGRIVAETHDGAEQLLFAEIAEPRNARGLAASASGLKPPREEGS